MAGVISSSSSMSQTIAAILDTLRNRKDLESLNTQEHAFSAKEIRKLLRTFIEGTLTDLDAVAAQFSKKSTGTPHSELIWTFFQHCIESFPECFVGVVHRQPTESFVIANEAPRLPVVRSCDQAAKAFILWVLTRLMRVLAEPGCLPLHPKSISAIHSIFQLVKTKDLVFYNSILTELVSLYRVLVIIDDSSVFDDKSTSPVTLPIELQHFQFFEIDDVSDKGAGGENVSKIQISIRCLIDHIVLQDAIR
ncbi:predicted protein [Nematostella vectensis]|uniref:Serine/threonine-protein kinase ATR-like N-HEAT region domain-containing protein n=1 Tax=Nematostella vectensis TaxID=45351 RepID=A7RQJ1_NEMVE|nr:predicted protein [Nematostella vectensis]|eukprot:XP_001638359.1 predicted protein [Nematostella vectensis]